MAALIWTETALEQLDDLAAYIALDNPEAAAALVTQVLQTVERLERFPNSGRKLPELPGTVYREVICSPCRILYRRNGKDLLILCVLREERLLRRFMLQEQQASR